MQLATTSIIDPTPVIDYYKKNGLSTDLLEKCNSIEFRYIDGAGEGYILTVNDGSFGQTELVSVTNTLTGSGVSYVMRVLNRLSLDHPLHSGTYLTVLHVAEPKYLLKKYFVARNYNEIIRSEVFSDDGTSQDFPTRVPDDTAKNFEDIVTDFIPSGWSLFFSGDEIILYNCDIKGMNVLDAIDHLCATYGYFWTVVGTSIYIRSAAQILLSDSSSSDGAGNPSLAVVLPDPINDIRYPLLDNQFNCILTTFVAFNEIATDLDDSHTVKWAAAIPGRSLHTVDPFYFAEINSSESIVNLAGINERAALIRENMQAVGELLDYYIAKHIFEPYPLGIFFQNFSKVRYADYGNGPRSIFSCIPYPFVTDRPGDDVSGDAGGGACIEYIIQSVITITDPTSPYFGLKEATVLVELASPGLEALIGETVKVIDHSQCVFDLLEEQLQDVWGWASKKVARSLAEAPSSSSSSVSDLTPGHWSADDRCCTEFD